MKIKLVHAYFLVSLGDYSNERIGFTVELEADETVESVVSGLRQQAITAIGPKSEELYDRNRRLRAENRDLEDRQAKLRSEWDATAEFLRAQGIKPEAPSMPQFQNLLSAARPESELITAEMVEEDSDPDDIPFEGANTPDGF